MTEAKFSENKLKDIAFWGLRAAVGVIFIVHGYGKISNPGFSNWLVTISIPPEMAFLIGLAELVPGILLIVGVLTRISASFLSVIMLGAIFHVKGAQSLTGEGGYEFELILLASCLVIIVSGPGRVSISNIAKKIPRPLH